MFKITPNPTFTVPVTGFVPGQPREGLTVEFRYKSPDDFTAWLGTFEDRTLGEVLMDVIVGWRDAPLEFTQESIDSISKTYPAFIPSLLATYRAELFDAKAKN